MKNYESKVAITSRPGSPTPRFRWIAATLLGFFAVATTACGGEPQGDDGSDVPTVEATSNTDIFGGSPDIERLSGVVALRIGDRAPFEICSGALVAPNVLLTARHCVSRMVAKSVVCTDRGQSANGAHVAEDHALSQMGIYSSEHPDFHAAPDANVTAVVHVGGASLCNSDIALLVLDRAPAGTAPLPVRFGKGVQANESIRAVGYGKSDDQGGPGTRMRRDGVGVLEVGAKLTPSDTALGDHEFEVGRSICQGDSGGPSISEATGAVVGVVSRGADCRQDFGHVYTQTAGFEALFARALEIAGGTVQSEGGRDLHADDLAAGPVSDSPSAPPASAGGCSMASTTPRSAPGAFALALIALGAAFTRRRAR